MGVHQPQNRARLRINTSTFMLYLFRRAAPDERGVVFIHSFGRRKDRGATTEQTGRMGRWPLTTQSVPPRIWNGGGVFAATPESCRDHVGC